MLASKVDIIPRKVDKWTYKWESVTDNPFHDSSDEQTDPTDAEQDTEAGRKVSESLFHPTDSVLSLTVLYWTCSSESATARELCEAAAPRRLTLDLRHEDP
jgi:hypothetical protein